MPLKTRPDLEAEAIRLIRAVETNIVLDAKEVLVQSLDRIQVDSVKWAASVVHDNELRSAGIAHTSPPTYSARVILKALENRDKL